MQESPLARRAKLWSLAALTLAFAVLTTAESSAIWYHLVDVPRIRSTGLLILLTIWIILATVMIRDLAIQRELADVGAPLARQPLIVAFLAVCLISAYWSVAPEITLMRSVSLMLATFSALYLVRHRDLDAWLNVLVWLSVAGLIASYLLALLAPGVGTDLNPPYSGAWRGLFWHKNHLGVVAPGWSMVFLFHAVAHWQRSAPLWRALTVGLYGMSLGLVVLAESTTGYILAIATHAAVGLVLIWLRTRKILRPKHYLGFLGGSALAVVLAASNSGSILSALGKSPSLTGRIPLWNHLLSEWVNTSPWLGHGFGAIWSVDEFRLGLKESLGWGYAVRIADNGALDLMLDLGVVGLLLFLAIFARATIAALSYGRSQNRLAAFFPSIFLLYWGLSNVAFSLLLQTEVFTWCTLVALVVIMGRSESDQGAARTKTETSSV